MYCSTPCQRRASYLRNGTPAVRGSRTAYYGRKWREDPAYRASRERQSAHHHLRRKYGVSIDDYDRMVEAQGGTCAICGTTAPDEAGLRWNVDHDHETGAVRGLLCRNCNVGLGKFGDDIELLRRAIAYLEDPPCASL